MKINFKILGPPYKENSTPEVKRVRMQVLLVLTLSDTHLFMENSDLFDTMVTQLRRVNGKKFGEKKKKVFLEIKM